MHNIGAPKTDKLHTAVPQPQAPHIKISVFLEHLYDAAAQTGQPLAKIFELARGFGILGLETDFQRLRENPGLPGLAREKGLEISCVYAHFDFSHRTDLSGALEILDILQENGIKLFMPIPGFCTPEDDRESCFRRMVSGMEKVIAEARERGITVCMEDYDDSPAIYSTTDGLSRFLEALPQLGCAFDTGNFRYSGESELAAFERMKKRIVHLHCKDRSSSRKRPGDEAKIALDGAALYPCAVGEGMIGIEKIGKTLLGEGYDGWFAIEHFGSADQLADMKKSVENIRKWENDLRNGME